MCLCVASSLLSSFPQYVDVEPWEVGVGELVQNMKVVHYRK